MFRAQTNAFDDVVVKATDENLTSENWEYILVCGLYLMRSIGDGHLGEVPIASRILSCVIELPD